MTDETTEIPKDYCPDDLEVERGMVYQRLTRGGPGMLFLGTVISPLEWMDTDGRRHLL